MDVSSQIPEQCDYPVSHETRQHVAICLQRLDEDMVSSVFVNSCFVILHSFRFLTHFPFCSHPPPLHVLSLFFVFLFRSSSALILSDLSTLFYDLTANNLLVTNYTSLFYIHSLLYSHVPTVTCRCLLTNMIFTSLSISISVNLCPDIHSTLLFVSFSRFF